MGEECKREGELNERDLEGVSGGALSAEWAQKSYCDRCVAKLNSRQCSGSAEQLAEYVSQYGRNKMLYWQSCPFLSHG